jgi:hypothetical protein
MFTRRPLRAFLNSNSDSSAVNIEPNTVQVYPFNSGIDQERAFRAHLCGREARLTREIEVPSPTRSSDRRKLECLRVIRASGSRRNDPALGPNLRTDLAKGGTRRRFALRPW